MDRYIKDLFKDAVPFCDSDLQANPNFLDHFGITYKIESMMYECFGGEVASLFREYIAAQIVVEQFQALHYFHQGYLAAKEELAPDGEI